MTTKRKPAAVWWPGYCLCCHRYFEWTCLDISLEDWGDEGAELSVTAGVPLCEQCSRLHTSVHLHRYDYRERH